MTLNDLERPIAVILRYFTEFNTFGAKLRNRDRPLFAKKVAQRIRFSAIHNLCDILKDYTEKKCIE